MVLHDKYDVGALIDTPSCRYRSAVTASDVNQPVDVSAGKAWIINGDLFFSPNSTRPVGYPPAFRDFIYIRKTDEADVKELHQPIWWSDRTAYLAFLPLAPNYDCYPFSDLLNLRFREDIVTTLQLEFPTVRKWKELEHHLLEILQDMRNHYGFPDPEPIMTTAVNTGVGFKNTREFHEKITRLQGWFAVWQAQLSHAIASAQAIDAKAEEREDGVPAWMYRLCRHRKWDQGLVSGINSSVAHFHPGFERVGVFLNVLDILNLSPLFSVDFFLRFHVPVWYRWGTPQIEAAKTHPQIARLAPLPEQLQDAATFVIQTPAAKNDRPWITFFAERKWQEPFVIRSESAGQKKQRLGRALNYPQNSTTNVYVWKLDVDGNYVRKHIDRCENAFTLGHFGVNQKVYNPVFDEWDCGLDLGNLTEDEEAAYGPPMLYAQSQEHGQDLDDLDDGPSWLPAGPTQNLSAPFRHQISLQWYTAPNVPDRARSFAIETYPVMQTLYEYFGFVAPLPVPKKYPLSPHKLLDNEIKQFCRILGIEQLDPDFLQSVLMQYAFKFISDLGDSNDVLPPSDLFDISPHNRLYVGASSRWHFIKKTDTDWFILFLPPSVAQAKWRIAVDNPIIALLLCRLNQSLSDYELCNFLVRRGIRFHTFVQLSSFPHRPLPSLLTTIRLSDYKFTHYDYKLYLDNRERLLSDPRIRRAALMRGGIIWRLASSHISNSEALMGPTPSVLQYGQGILVPALNDNEVFCDDGLHLTEMDALCGLVHCYTGRGEQQQYLSWWPLDSTWRKDVEFPFWNERLESLVQGRLKELESGSAKPLNATEWHRRIRSSSHVRRIFRNLGNASAELFI